MENLCFPLLSVNFAQPKQEKFNISNTPEYPPKLFNFGIKRFRGDVCTPVVKIIQNSLIVILYSSSHGSENLEPGFLYFPVPLCQLGVSDIFPPGSPEDLSQF